MKRIGRCLYLVSLLLVFWIPFANAQDATFGIGFGTNHVKASATGIDSNTLGACTPATDIFCQPTPSLNGFFLGFGGDVMISKNYGVGGEVSFLPSKGNYGPFLFRQTFYDFNGILEPFHQSKRVVPKFMGGIGGAKTGFSVTGCVGTAVLCSNSTVGSSNHFQLHAGAGVEILLTEHLFIRPQFDFRYIPGFTDQFGSNLVYGGMFWLGFKSSR
jgi:opacity protein-like surface antigen